jgi:O-methyltransferase involved in polyketide biosynthesis
VETEPPDRTRLGLPAWLQLVPVDFEAGDSWWSKLVDAGFDADRPAVVVSTGVSMYLTKDANSTALPQMARLAPGSTLAMTYLVPSELLDEADRPGFQMAEQGARASGTPFISYYSPEEMLGAARVAGLKEVQHVAGTSFAQRYFTGRSDGLRPSSGEDFLIAST